MVWVNAKLESVGCITKDYDPINITGFDHVKNDYATFTNLAKSSSIVKLAVGIDQELHYWTEDEYGTSTPGSQSFKYYLTNRFRIYDKVTVYDDFDGEIILNKVDETDNNKKLNGAAYELYRENGTLVGSYTTGKDGQPEGQIKVTGMPLGKYYFKEVTAPEGYLVDINPINVELKANATESVHTLLGGGETQITPTEGTIVTAAANERFMVGSNKVDSASPDITFTAGAGADVKQVTVDSILDVNGASQPKTETFSTLKEAQDAINGYKNSNLLRGEVTVHVEQEQAGAGKPVAEVTATNKPVEKKDITVKKDWKDNVGWQGTHPDITIRLHRNGKEVDHKILKHSETSHTFTGLPKTDEYGTAYVYSVTEDVIISQQGMKGYATSIKGNTENNAFTITNIWNEKDRVQISGQKKWTDMGNKLGKRPTTVSFMLKQDGDEYATAVASEENGWTFTFTNVPMYFADKDVLHTYTIEEVGALPIEYVTPQAVTVDTNGHQHMDTVDVKVTNALDPIHRSNASRVCGNRIASQWRRIPNNTSKCS